MIIFIVGLLFDPVVDEHTRDAPPQAARRGQVREFL
jgi:hypothetical protein